VVAKEGRFGVYVTDGETNASLTKGDRLEAMPPERAYELLAIRREAAPSKPKRGAAKKAPAVKKAPAAKKAPAKKTAAAKKAPAKKAAAKKAAAATD
jgi:DNA topoisomerase I